MSNNNRYDYITKWWQAPNIDTTWQTEVVEDKENKWAGGNINPKMFRTKEELNLPDNNVSRIDYTENKTPNYYVGRHYKYEARKVVEDFDLSYNSGVVVSYLLRAGKKTEEGISNIDKHIEDIVKSINHLEFELEVLNNLKNKEDE
jgi:hypothetical protein